MSNQARPQRFQASPDWLPSNHILHDIGRALNLARVAAEASIQERPVLALLLAFGTGGLVGWLVKRS
jgi:hypothetical protein